MASVVCTLALTLAALAAVPHAAAAQSVADTLRKWGLLGTWALDCSKPASGDNGYLRYVVSRPGQVSHERDFGDRSDVNEVKEAKTGIGGRLELVVHFAKLSQTRQYAMIMGADGRTRAVANSLADGTGVTIKDGILTHSGNPSPWQTRCN